MSIIAQCGYGRSTKIQDGLAQGTIEGVILSPRDEKKDKLEGFAAELASDYPDAVVLFDPQFYASTIIGANDARLQEYDYYSSNLNRLNFPSNRLRKYVEDCLNYQHDDLGAQISYILSPTVLFDDFRDNWSQISLDLAIASADYHANLDDPKALLISLVFSEGALNSFDALEEYLDALTELEVAGFYVIVRRNSQSLSHSLESQAMAHLMYMTHVLSNINEYELIFGYTDWYSFLLHSAGAGHTASGWYQSLRQLSLGRFLPSTGGRRPRKRYSSLPMLSCPLIYPELEDIFQVGSLPQVLTGSQYDRILAGGPAAGESAWNDEDSCLHHWTSLSKLAAIIDGQATSVNKLNQAENLIRNAAGLYRNLEQYGVSFEASTGPSHLVEWQNGLREFRSLAGV